MTNDTMGIIGVFAITGVLFLLRHLIVTVGKPRRRVPLQRNAPPVKTGLRAVESRRAKEPEELRTKKVMMPNHPGNYPRFRI